MTTPPPSKPDASTPARGTPAAGSYRPVSDPAAFEEPVIARIALLKEERDANPEREPRAVLQTEIGRLTQESLHQEAAAVREYLAAYNFDIAYRPPLLSLLQILERRRSARNLVRLYKAEQKSAVTPLERASALTSQAGLMEDLGRQPPEIRELYEKALEEAPDHRGAQLGLEYLLLRTGDVDAIEVIERRAKQAGDPVLQAMLYLEVARAKEDGGDIEGALAIFREALKTPAARLRILEELERVARRSGRHDTLAEALEARAELLAAAARGEDQGQGSGLYSVQRFMESEQCAAEAVALYREAGRLRAVALRDGEKALADYDAALEIQPDDPLARGERMLALEALGDSEAIAEEAERQLRLGGLPPTRAAALRFRLAEHAIRSGDEEAATAALKAAVALDPAGRTAEALLEDRLLDAGDLEGLLARIEAQLEAREGPAKAFALHLAAQIALQIALDPAEQGGPHQGGLDPIGRGLAYLQRAMDAADPGEARLAMARERIYAALRADRREEAAATLRAVLGENLAGPGLEEDERSAYTRELFLLLDLKGDAEATGRLLVRAIDIPSMKVWSLDAARIWAAARGEVDLLAAVHRRFSDQSEDPDVKAAHLSAAGRALAREGRDKDAEAPLREALTHAPGHPYALALLEEILRASGQDEEVVRLRREAAAEGGRGAETQLLLAGAAAEAAGDYDEATRAYEEAGLQDPDSMAPLFALLRLADIRRDADLLAQGLETLSMREIERGEPGYATLALAECYELRKGEPDRARESFRAALEGEPDTALAGALGLALLPMGQLGVEDRLEALKRLAIQMGAKALPGLQREIAGVAIASDRELAYGDEVLEQLLANDPTDRLAHILRLALLARQEAKAREAKAREAKAREAGAHEAAPGATVGHALGQKRSDLWASLARSTGDDEAAADLLLHAMRAGTIALGEEGFEDGVLIAHELAELRPGSADAAIALDESLSGGDDPYELAEAFAQRRAHANEATTLAIRSAEGRALAAAGSDPMAALRSLLKVAVEDEDDLASWEAIRMAARDAEAWAPLVEACDRLAHLVDDEELAAMLLEESAAVLMDELHDDARATRRLRRVLAIDPTRPIAYHRLHDLLAEAGDVKGLLHLVSSRIERIDDSEDLIKLFYEQARLLRSVGRREEALEALDNLLMLDSDHVGGLALLVELNVQMEAWEEAVEALRSLAEAPDVPDSQRRIARLGAADFLEAKLSDLKGALAELRAIDEIGLGEASLYLRMEKLAGELGDTEQQLDALEKAALLEEEPEEQARHYRRAGEIALSTGGDPERAISAYQKALAASPTDLVAGEALAGLLDPEAGKRLSEAFEAAVREELRADPTDPELLRKLRAAAVWRGDHLLEHAVLNTLCALSLEDEEEVRTYDELEEAIILRPKSGTPPLAKDLLESLRSPEERGPLALISPLLSETLAEAEGLLLDAFGVGRDDQIADGPGGGPGSNPLREAVSQITDLLGVPGGDFYAGGSDLNGATALPHDKGRIHWIIGHGVRTPLTPMQRFVVGRQAAALRISVTALARRAPKEAATLFFAAAEVAESPLPAGVGRAGLAEATRRIDKAMPRKVKKALPALLGQITDGGRGVEAYCRAIRRTTGRLGVAVAGDVRGALEAVVGHPHDRDAVLASEEARDLILFWLSPDAARVRRALGLVR